LNSLLDELLQRLGALHNLLKEKEDSRWELATAVPNYGEKIGVVAHLPWMTASVNKGAADKRQQPLIHMRTRVVRRGPSRATGVRHHVGIDTIIQQGNDVVVGAGVEREGEA
jgi:hypothetical protein